ncbi:MAG: hypothetical protein AAFN63_03930 [Pseudomonadota bacterium]
MELVVGIIAVMAFTGAVLAILEYRRGKSYLRHDFNKDTSDQSEADRELMRIEQKLDAMDHNRHGPLM